MGVSDLPTDAFRLDRFRKFVVAFGELINEHPAEDRILATGGELLAGLVCYDDWLPPAFAEPDVARYRQYLLHCDSSERFSVLSFVWGPGQETPVHDHTVWGLVGMLRGAEFVQSYARSSGTPVPTGPRIRLSPGDIGTISPAAGDIHQVCNALVDRPSISIHVYGANMGAVRRSAFAADGTQKPFVSGYANDALPNIWQNAGT
jgi:predicted metal-dependent enzyme (double-stranded beta helix superfamily)